MFSQNDPVPVFAAKDIEGKLWYGSSNFYSDRVIFLKKALPTDGKSQIRFMAKSGKIIFCDSLLERRSVFSANGQETFLEPGKHCDSTSTKYQVKNDIIHITQDGVFHYYFKIVVVRTGNLELLLEIPESFHKN